MIHGVIDPTFLSGLILFQLVSIKSQLITTSIRFQGSTILRLWNPRSNDSNRIRTNLERLTPHNYGTGPISSRSSDDWPFPTAQVLSLRDLLTTGKEDRVSAAYMHCRLALKVSVLISLLFSSIQVGCRLNARQNVFPRSQLLLFLPFTRVRLNNIKGGIQIPHTRHHSRKLILSG